MATYRSLLLVAALCMGTVSSLRCYTCAAQSSNTNCMTATNCTATDKYCMTSVVAGGIGNLSSASITKTCTSVCTAAALNIIVFSTSASCCSSDLCNISGSTSIKSNYTIFAGTLGVIMFVLRSSSL